MGQPEKKISVRDIKAGEMDFLLGELDLWRGASLITEEQAVNIRSLYAVRRRPLSRVLLGAGGALVGLGLLSFVAANWLEMPRPLRVVLIVAGYILSLIAARQCGKKNYPRSSGAFLLLGSFIYGGGIFLMGQMFHYGGHWTTAIGWWIAGVVPAALLFRDDWELSLIQILSLLYLTGIDAANVLRVFLTGARAPLTALFTPAGPLVLIAVLWGVWACLGGRLAFNVNVILSLLLLSSRLTLCRGVSMSLLVQTCLGFALSLFATRSIKGGATEAPDAEAETEPETETGETETRGLRDDLAGIGLLMAGAFGLLLTWPEFWRDSPLLSMEWAGAFLEMGFASVRSGFSVATALVLAPLLLWQLHRGQAMGGIFFALLAGRYFFDHIFGFMSKALGFTTTGILCLALGFVIERRLRRRQAVYKKIKNKS